MPDFLNPFAGQIEDTMIAAWPDITATMEYERVERMAWEGLTASYGVYTISDMPLDETYGTTNTSFRCQVEMAYLMHTNGSLATLRSKISDMVTRVQASGLPAVAYGGQFINFVSLSYSDSIRANAYFIAGKLPFRCATVTIDCLVGYLVEE